MAGLRQRIEVLEAAAPLDVLAHVRAFLETGELPERDGLRNRTTLPAYAALLGGAVDPFRGNVVESDDELRACIDRGRLVVFGFGEAKRLGERGRELLALVEPPAQQGEWA